MKKNFSSYELILVNDKSLDDSWNIIKNLCQSFDWIKGIVAEPELNVIYSGTVVKVVDFGAFVNFIGNRDGLVHISEIQDKRTNKVEDVLKVDQEVNVKLR